MKPGSYYYFACACSAVTYDCVEGTDRSVSKEDADSDKTRVSPVTGSAA